MNDDTEDADAAPVVRVSRDLSAILELAATLERQVVHKANDRLMPGGLAMAGVATVSSLAEWSEQLESAEHHAIANPDRWAWPEIEDDDEYEPPLQTLLFWSEAWRVEHGYPLTVRPTLASEANFIRWALSWAWDNELHWDEFAVDINRARLRLENVLYAGKRVERTHVHCDRPHCETRPRLIKLGVDEATDEDRWKCPNCKTKLDVKAFRDAYAAQLRSESAAKFVWLPDAIHTLRAQGRGETTIRRWLKPAERIADRCTECGSEWEPQEHAACPAETDEGECGGDLMPVWKGDLNEIVEGYCELATHRVWVWWPDLWRLHNTTRTTPRAVS